MLMVLGYLYLHKSGIVTVLLMKDILTFNLAHNHLCLKVTVRNLKKFISVTNNSVRGLRSSHYVHTVSGVHFNLISSAMREILPLLLKFSVS